MTKLIRLGLVLGSALVAIGCTAEAPKCTPQNCANGCCSAAGVCETAGRVDACGLNGEACKTMCTVCMSGLCIMPNTSADSGMLDAGPLDAGVDCATVGDAVLGTLEIINGQIRVQASSALPAGVVAVTTHQGGLYGLTEGKAIHNLGSFPSLTLGARVASVVPAGIDAGSGFFLGGYLASSGGKLLAGFTQSGAGFPGKVAVVTVADAGVEFVNAPGNYTAAGIESANAFIINGAGLGSATGNAVYALRTEPTQTAQLATFDTSLGASGSGLTAITSTGVVLVGYGKSDFTNAVHAVPPSTYLAPVLAGTSVNLTTSSAPLVAEGDVADMSSLGGDAMVVRGGFDSDFNPYTSKVQRVGLTLSGSGVAVGTPVDVLRENGSRCTRVLFVSGGSTSMLVGLQDGKGRRLVQFIP
ncbi:MAG: hypothetical protein JNG84_12495 [Archangium sp.]|nr:hypothetical protein [Archangium sp.]